jgi:hypothetical protein
VPSATNDFIEEARILEKLGCIKCNPTLVVEKINWKEYGF